MEKEIKEKLIRREMEIQREIYMCKLYNNYVKLLYKQLELWVIRKKMLYNKKKHKRRLKNVKIRKR